MDIFLSHQIEFLLLIEVIDIHRLKVKLFYVAFCEKWQSPSLVHLTPNPYYLEVTAFTSSLSSSFLIMSISNIS